MLCRQFAAVHLPACRQTRAVVYNARAVCRRQRVSAAAAPAPSSCSPELDSKWKPLLALVVDKVRTFLGNASLSDEQIIELLEEQQLLGRPELYHHLYSFLRYLKVRTVVGPNIRTHTSGISYVDPRCPGNISHDNSWAAAGVSGVKPVITCAEAIARLLRPTGQQLKYPGLFCVAILHGSWRNDPVPSKRYRTWPVECCLFDASDSLELIRANDDRDDEWPLCPPGHCASAGICRPRMPSWVADYWEKSQSAQGSLGGTQPPATLGPAAAAASATTYAAPSWDVHTGSDNFTPAPSTTAAGSNSSSSSSSSSGSTQSSWQPYQDGIALDRLESCNAGFLNWTNQLYPTDDVQTTEHAVVKAVYGAAKAASRGQLWGVAAVRPVGSFNKKTSLRDAHDLDLLVELNSNLNDFEKHTSECLNSICRVLCSPAPAHVKPAGNKDAKGPSQCSSPSVVQSGWKLESKSAYWVWLSHPRLGLSLDIKTSPCLMDAFDGPSNGQWHYLVLKHIIQRAEAEQTGAHPPPSGSSLLESYTRPWVTNKEHSSVLSPLLSKVVKGANDRFAEKYGVKGAGSLVTTVIRAMKAWSKGLAPTAAAGTSKSAPAYPPGYVWEVFVLYVLERQLKQCRDEGICTTVYSLQLGAFTLFMDVLLAASKLLRPTDWGQPKPEPIAVYYFYTAKNCMRAWGPSGPLYTPFIIHPADPRYNCVMHTGFCNWGALADAAGLLHQQLQQLLYPQGENVVGAEGKACAADGSSSSSSVDVWQLVVDTTSLGPAVRAAGSNLE